MLSIVHGCARVTLGSSPRTYNPVGNRFQAVEVVLEPESTPPATPVTIDYAYDSLGMLTAADNDTGSIFHYAHDAVGNRTSLTDAMG